MNELVSSNMTGSIMGFGGAMDGLSESDEVSPLLIFRPSCCFRVLFNFRFVSRYSKMSLAKMFEAAIPSRVLLLVDMSGRPNKSSEICFGLFKLIEVALSPAMTSISC